LVISQFIQGNFQKNVRLIFFYYFIQRYFDYFIIIFSRYFDYFIMIFPFFWFNRGYSVNDRLDFALTVIKRDYNANDRLEFILSFIR